MQAQQKRSLLIILGTTLLTASLPAIWKYREWRMITEKNALEDLKIDSLEINGATFDQALRVVVDKVRALGHPESQLHIYEDGRALPNFHERLKGYGFTPPPLINLRIVPDGKNVIFVGPMGSQRGERVTLRDVLWQVGFWAQLPCAVRGHDVVAARTPGTLQRYRKANFRMPDFFWSNYSDREIAGLVRNKDFGAYEGMAIRFRRARRDVEFVGPEDEYERFEREFLLSRESAE